VPRSTAERRGKGGVTKAAVAGGGGGGRGVAWAAGAAPRDRRERDGLRKVREEIRLRRGLK
jgi:hypothetical protein